MIEKYASRRIRVQIRHVLMDVWDPIGVKGIVQAEDEYDSYIGKVYDLLLNKATDTTIADYLYRVVHDNMGLDGATESDMMSTVEALRKIEIPSDSR